MKMEKLMTLERGDMVWIPCEVTRGVFPDERNVRIQSPAGDWTGFVDVRQLRDEIADGRTAIRATLVEGARGELSARLPGQTSRRQYLSVSAAQRERLQQV
jgi:hypothetical protein